jgi:hypothetical protein
MGEKAESGARNARGGRIRPSLSTARANFDRRSEDVMLAASGRRMRYHGGNVKLLLLLAPCVLALWVPLYNSIPPVLFGIPFFYWFQLVLIPVSALAIVAADRIGRD